MGLRRHRLVLAHEDSVPGNGKEQEKKYDPACCRPGSLFARQDPYLFMLQRKGQATRSRPWVIASVDDKLIDLRHSMAQGIERQYLLKTVLIGEAGVSMERKSQRRVRSRCHLSLFRFHADQDGADDASLAMGIGLLVILFAGHQRQPWSIFMLQDGSVVRLHDRVLTYGKGQSL